MFMCTRKSERKINSLKKNIDWPFPVLPQIYCINASCPSEIALQTYISDEKKKGSAFWRAVGLRTSSDGMHSIPTSTIIFISQVGSVCTFCRVEKITKISRFVVVVCKYEYILITYSTPFSFLQWECLRHCRVNRSRPLDSDDDDERCTLCTLHLRDRAKNTARV